MSIAKGAPKIKNMDIKTIEWQRNSIKIIDQTKLPLKLEYIYIKDIRFLWQAIKTMKIRGAPALGAAAGLGVYLGIKDSTTKNFLEFEKELVKVKVPLLLRFKAVVLDKVIVTVE